ncbi:hypothetical protein [Haloparvum sp. PAK95]|uniref:hypothetical protein n=1 Tax=Haloparvum sp. PAK95 TaxID=3418962 RepID=UPI003D2F3F34
MNPSSSDADAADLPAAVTSEGYRITTDGDDETFFALCIEEPDSDDAWIMSDTVRGLDGMR